MYMWHRLPQVARHALSILKDKERLRSAHWQASTQREQVAKVNNRFISLFGDLMHAGGTVIVEQFAMHCRVCYPSKL